MIITCCREIPRRWIAFAILPWASFALNSAVIGAAFVFSIKKFVENPAGVTFVLSLPGILAIVVAPLASFLSDRVWTRFGRRKPFVVSASACMVAGLVAMPLMPNFWALVAAFILYHVGDGLSSPRDPLKQEIVPPHERGRATGAMTWCQNFATVVFYSVMLGRFDEVTFFAGVPLHGESVIYWSAALLLGTMLLLVALGIRETDQKSPLRGERLSIRNFVGGLLDRELWPVYLIVFSFGLLNFFSGFGPFLSTLLYTDQWLYTKQEMGTNVAIGGVVNIFIIGLLTMFADRLPRMKAFRTFICLSLACNVVYFCYVNFVLPDRRPSLVEIILFGEVLSILSILIGLVYVPLTYDYVRRNKMGTFAAGAQIATRGTQLFTLNGVGLFVWAYAVLFQPPAGETARVVLRDDTDRTALLATLHDAEWTYPHEAKPAPASELSATGWQGDNVVTDFGRAWEIRLRNRASETLAEERKTLETRRAALVAEQKKHLDAAASADQRGRADRVAAATEAAARSGAESEALARRIEVIDLELAGRAARLREQLLAVLGPQLMANGDQVVNAQLHSAVLIDLLTTGRPEGKVVERLLADLRREQPGVIDLRPLKLERGYGVAVSAVVTDDSSAEEAAAALRRVLERLAAERAPQLLAADAAPLDVRTEPALTLELQIVEQPVVTYVSPVTRAVNGVLALFDRAPSPARKLDAIARQLRVAEETNHVRVTAGGAERTIAVTAVLQPTATRAATAADAVAERIVAQLGGGADDVLRQQARAFYERAERAAATQRITVAQPVLGANYAPMRYDYMSGYIWVFFVGVIGIALTFVFGRLEARGRVRKRGVEEAEAS
jgi:Na+/melibiose symporter-like transporter